MRKPSSAAPAIMATCGCCRATARTAALALCGLLLVGIGCTDADLAAPPTPTSTTRVVDAAAVEQADTSATMPPSCKTYAEVTAAAADWLRQQIPDLTLGIAEAGEDAAVIDRVLARQVDVAIVRSDHQYQALHDRQPAATDLRTLCCLHTQALTLVSRVDAGVETVADLRGKRLALDETDAGLMACAYDILHACHIDPDSDLSITADDGLTMLENGEVDACLLLLTHPSRRLHQLDRPDLWVVPIDGGDIDAMLARRPGYCRTIVPCSGYGIHNSVDPSSIGVMATLVTSAATDDRLIHQVMATIVSGLDDLARLHPSLARLSESNLCQSLSAPLHPGARQLYADRM